MSASKSGKHPPKASKMPSQIAMEMRDAILTAGAPKWGDNVKSVLHRAADRLGIKYRRARSLYYGNARRIEAAEYLAIKAKAQEIQRQNAARREANNEIRRTLAALDVRDAEPVERPLFNDGAEDQ